MQDRGRISVTAYDTEMIIVVRLHGDIHGAEFVEQALAGLMKVSRPWDYNFIIDLRRYEGKTLFDDVTAAVAAWIEQVGDKDKGRYVGVISTDLDVRARLAAAKRLFPMSRFDGFDTFDEGLDWIRDVRNG